MSAHIHIACNDPDNGQPTGFAEFIEIDFGNDNIVSIAGGRCVARYDHKTDELRISRMRVKARGYTMWHGNWCWDSCIVDLKDACKVFNRMQALQYWHCEEGPDWLYNAFNAKIGIVHSDPRFYA